MLSPFSCLVHYLNLCWHYGVSACRQTYISILYLAYRPTGTLQCLYFTMTLIVDILLIDYYVLKYVGACVLTMHRCV